MLCLSIWLTQSRNYLLTNRGSLLPLLAVLPVFILGIFALLWLSRRRLPGDELLRRALPGAMLISTLAAGAFLVSRPLWQVGHAFPANPVLERFQTLQGLTPDGTRTYAENSVAWTAWWTGPVAMALCLLTMAGLAWRFGEIWRDDKPWPNWVGPSLIGFGSAILTLTRPGIVPDHPWADRRLFVVIPFIMLGAVAFIALSFNRLRRQSRALGVSALLLGLTVVLLPPERTHFHATERVNAGQLHMIREVCNTLRPGDVVLVVDQAAAYTWPQVLRGMCGAPTFAIRGLTTSNAALAATVVADVVDDLKQTHHHLVLVGTDKESVRGAVPSNIVPTGSQDIHLETIGDEASLLKRPDGANRVGYSLSIARLEK